MRSCRDCARWLYDEDGTVSYQWAPNPAGGEPLEVPAERPANVPPPCWACPKWAGVEPDGEGAKPAPLTGAADLFAGAWLNGLRRLFFEVQAVGVAGVAGDGRSGLDRFTRAALALVAEAERDADRQHLARVIADAIRPLLRR